MHEILIQPEEAKFCLYARKSTEGDEKQTMSIDSQIKEMKVLADRDGINVLEIREERYSAKQSGMRPVFNLPPQIPDRKVAWG